MAKRTAESLEIEAPAAKKPVDDREDPYILPLPGDTRLTVTPIARPDLFEYYKTALQCHWIVEEVDLSTDRFHYMTKLTDGQRHFVDFVLSFFAVSDKIVNINLAKRFKEEVPIYEAELFYDFQIAMENIHAEMYSLQLDAIIPDPKRREELLNGIENIPTIAKMGEWMKQCITSTESFPIRLLRMACVEGIFFTSCFCAIYWLKNLGLMPGLGMANEFIARDEGLHTLFALHLFKMVQRKYRPTDKQIKEIVEAAVKIAKEFTVAALPIDLPEMNARLMGNYIECSADNLLTIIDVEPIYKTKNPFAFSVQLNLTNRVNFFERRNSAYSKKRKVDEPWGFDKF